MIYFPRPMMTWRTLAPKGGLEPDAGLRGYRLARLFFLFCGLLWLGSTFAQAGVYLSSYRFTAGNLPTIFTNEALNESPHFRLRAKINGTIHLAETWDNGSFTLNGTIPGPGTYVVDLYVARYDASYGFIESVGSTTAQITIDPPLPAVALTSYSFTADNLPIIYAIGTLPSTYVLRAKINGSFYSSASNYNNQTHLVGVPGYGNYLVELYCVRYESGAVVDYGPLPFFSQTLTIGSPRGTGTGLLGQYYGSVDEFASPAVFARIDSEVNFQWGVAAPDNRIGADGFAVRWTGQVQPRYSETYLFSTISDDGVRLWVNNQLLVNNWNDHGATENSGYVSLAAGQKYEIRMEYYERGGGATAQLIWQSLSQPREIVPQSQLYPANNTYAANGTYYIRDTDYASGSITTTDRTSQNERIEAGPTVNVLSGAVVDYVSPHAIRLVPGFRATSGSNFTARLSGPVTHVNPVRVASRGFSLPGAGDHAGPVVAFSSGDGWTTAARQNLGSKPIGGAAVGADVPADWPTGPGTSIGATKGSFAVSSGGAATYRIPIPVTPGTAGMQPHLALEYSSQGGDGYVGHGWQLSGLTTISRGSASYAIDGFAKGVNFDADDRFYLNGSRLIAVAGTTYGADGTEYRTETDPSTRVISYGSAGSGPEWFKIWSKDGQIVEIGNTANSRLKRAGTATDVIQWFVNKVSDRFDNYMSVEYKREAAGASTVEIYPETIKYTCRAGTLPNGYATVNFGYDDDVPEKSDGFVHGTAIGTHSRLRSITSKYLTETYRALALQYTESIAGEPRKLASVQESTKDGASYPLTEFIYQPRGPEGYDIAATPHQLGGVSDSQSDQVRVGDMNGDGLTDVVRVRGKSMELWLNDGSSFALADTLLLQFLGGTQRIGANSIVMADVDGDGKAEAVILEVGATIVRWNGSRLSYTGSVPIPGAQSGIASFGYDLVHSGDFNGDGRDDVAIFRTISDGVSAPTGFHLILLTSTGNSFTVSTDENSLNNKRLWLTAENSSNRLYPGNFTGAGGLEVAWIGNDSPTADRFMVYRWNGTALVPTITRPLNDPLTFSGPHKADYLPIDINGDGLTDLLGLYEIFDGVKTTSAEMLLSRGDGNFLSSGTQGLGGSNADFKYVPIDYNGDSRTDIAKIWKTPNSENRPFGETRLEIWMGNGRGFEAVPLGEQAVINTTWQQNTTLLAGRFDRRPKSDLIYSYLDQQNRPLVRLARRGIDADTQNDLPAIEGNPNLLAAVVDGLKNRTDITYLAMLEGDGPGRIYTKGNDAVYPQADIQMPINVVSRVMENDGLGGKKLALYSYGGLRTDAKRGLQGFMWIEMEDPQSGLINRTSFFQQFPYTGIVKSTEVKLAGSGVTIRSTTNAVNQKIFPHDTFPHPSNRPKNTTYFPYLESSVDRSYEFNSAAISTVRTEYAYDDFGSSTEVTQHTYPGAPSVLNPEDGAHRATAYEKRTVVQYDNFPESWLIGLPRRTETTARLPGDISRLTRTTAVDYFPGTAKPKSKTVEPDSSALWSRESYAYDDYGNIETVTATGADFDERVTKTDYGATASHPHGGRFPGKSYNALNHSVTHVYDTRLGVPLSKKDDANALTTSWEYDAFGVVNREVRPDATEKTITYRTDATAVSYPLLNDTTLPAASSTGAYHVEVRTTGAPPSLTLYNSLGQAIRQQTVNADGVLVTTDTRYDPRGNSAGNVRPYLGGVASASKALWSWTDFDALNRPTTTHTPYENTHTKTWFEYAGLVVSSLNPRGVVTRTTRNAVGWTTEVYSNPPAVAGTPPGVDQSSVTFYHDAFGNVTDTVDDGPHTIHMVYDALGRKKSMSDPDMGTWTYSYYADGALKSQTDSNGKTTTFTYDVLGRTKTKSEGVQAVAGGNPVFDSNGVPTLVPAELRETEWTYDTAPSPEKGVGQPHYVVVKNAAIETFRQTWAYDDKARSIGTTRVFAGKTLVSTQSYDTAGRPWVTGYPGGTFGTYNVYNGLGHLKEVRVADDPTASAPQGQILWFATGADADGHTTSAILGNGSSVKWTYRPSDGHLSEITSRLALTGETSTGPLAKTWAQNFSFDPVGNLEIRHNLFPTTPTEQAANHELFTYDGINRLVEVEYGQSSSVLAPTKGYLYDQIGNITNKSDVGAYTYDPAHPHAVSTAGGGPARTYDAVGNLRTGPGGLVATWTHFNQPQTLARGGHTSTFAYGAQEERVVQDTDRGTTYYAGTSYERYEPKPVGGEPPAPAEDRYYVTTPTGRTALVKKSAGVTTTTYFHADHLGSIEIVSDEFARVVSHYSYDAWGLARGAVGWQNLAVAPPRPTTTRGFTDHEMLDDLGLIHMNGRIYDPVTGRFLRADPTIQAPENPQSYNRYTYVFNNPLSHTDPTGYLTVDFSGFSFGQNNSGPPAITVPGLNGVPFPGPKYPLGLAPNFISGTNSFTFNPSAYNSVAPNSGGNTNWTREDRYRAVAASLVYRTEDGGLLKKQGIPYSPKDGFQAALYYNSSTKQYYLAFRGTEPKRGADWAADAKQAFSLNTSQYNQAMTLARMVHRAVGGNVAMVGHSLGGGLASAASYATGADATTYNAAGLSYKYSQGIPGQIRAHYITGEILSTAQDFSTLPNAAGQRIPHDIPNITPGIFGVPIFPLIESGVRHSMDNFFKL